MKITFVLPEIQDSFVLPDLIRSFELERPLFPVGPPSWDLVQVLSFLRGSSVKPLSSCSLGQLTMKVLFLLSLAMAKRVGELQALSLCIAFRGSDLSVSYLVEFVAKTESVRNPLPRSFLVKSLEAFVGDMPEEHSFCPVRAMWVYLDRTSSLSPRPQSLFASPSTPLRPLSKNTLSFSLRRFILDAGAVADSSAPRTHSVLGVATLAAFMRNWAVSKVLEAASWRSNPVFVSLFERFVFFWIAAAPWVRSLLLVPSCHNASFRFVSSFTCFLFCPWSLVSGISLPFCLHVSGVRARFACSQVCNICVHGLGLPLSLQYTGDPDC